MRASDFEKSVVKKRPGVPWSLFTGADGLLGLSDVFTISRPSLREALRLLAVLGVIA